MDFTVSYPLIWIYLALIHLFCIYQKKNCSCSFVLIALSIKVLMKILNYCYSRLCWISLGLAVMEVQIIWLQMRESFTYTRDLRNFIYQHAQERLVWSFNYIRISSQFIPSLEVYVWLCCDKNWFWMKEFYKIEFC
jgi:hypothetical protein